MDRLLLGLLLGLLFAGVACALMLKLPLPDKRRAMMAAAADRLAAGILMGAAAPAIHPVIDGIIVALLVSVPGAIVTGKPGPILVPAVVFGAIGGATIAFVGS